MQKEIRNIILIGITGSGKSALANTLIGKEIFKEGDLSVSTTREINEAGFKWRNNQEYKVVDTIGINDTEISKKDVIIRLAEIIHFIPEGISHILFVYNGKFTKEELKIFKNLEKLVFESEVSKFVTIVRTNFKDFREEEKCNKDEEEMIKENKEVKKLIESCNGFLHVDNPVIEKELNIHSQKDKKVIERRRNEIKYAKDDRRCSRRRIMNHLEENFNGYYKLKISNWEILVSKIDEYFSQKENYKSRMTGEEVENLKKRIERLEEENLSKQFEAHLEETTWWKKINRCNIL